MCCFFIRLFVSERKQIALMADANLLFVSPFRRKSLRNEINMKKKRYEKLDGIRGFALLNMIVYHAIWDMVYLYQLKWNWYKSEGAYAWQQGICWTFIFLSGFCWPLGKHTLKRGLIVFLCGAVITLVTLLAMPQNRVVFGVLTLIGSCMLLMNLIDRWLQRLPALLGLSGSVLLFFLTRNVNDGYLGFEDFNLMKLPLVLYKNLFTTYIGFTAQDFYSTDYFSLLPWLFLFLAGYFTFRYLNGKRVMEYMKDSMLLPMEWLGRHSLEIYMIHQPLLYFGLELIFFNSQS